MDILSQIEPYLFPLLESLYEQLRRHEALTGEAPEWIWLNPGDYYEFIEETSKVSTVTVSLNRGLEFQGCKVFKSYRHNQRHQLPIIR